MKVEKLQRNITNASNFQKQNNLNNMKKLYFTRETEFINITNYYINLVNEYSKPLNDNNEVKNNRSLIKINQGRLDNK